MFSFWMLMPSDGAFHFSELVILESHLTKASFQIIIALVGG